MLLPVLIVDTETTSLNFEDGQIIEVGAVFCHLDTEKINLQTIEIWESLVSLRTKMDSKITRITGIIESELLEAPQLELVQINWKQWLQKNLNLFKQKNINLNLDLELLIVGHSINFDLNFLKAENWWLPEKIQIIDTVNLAKILLPNLKAVNLEYLQAALDLKPKNTADRLADKLRPHRATFDTLCTQNLLQYLFNLLQESKFSAKFLFFLQKNFLPLQITFSKSENFQDLVLVKEKKEFLKEKSLQIELTGDIVEASFLEKLNNVTDIAEKMQKIEALFTIIWPQNLALILCQMYTILFYQATLKVQNFQNYKIHGFGIEIKFAEFLLDCLLETKN